MIMRQLAIVYSDALATAHWRLAKCWVDVPRTHGISFVLPLSHRPKATFAALKRGLSKSSQRAALN